MSNLEKDIRVALSLLEGKEDTSRLGNYSLMHNMSNKCFDLYFKHFPIKDGNILTVLESVDSLLQAVCNGAKRVYAFDSNPLSFYMARLKVASLKHTSVDSFKNYFCSSDNDSYFDVSYYKKIKNYLDYNTRMFWDAVYSCTEYRFKLDNLIDNHTKNSNNYNIGFDSYLREYNYSNVQNRLYCTDIHYICTDVFDILSKIPDDIKFDSVFLSNIFDKMNLDGKVKYPLFIKKDLDKYLSDNGVVAVYSSINGQNSNPLDIIFTDYIDINNKDKVLVYKKIK